jgi:hypothetical protein
MSTEMVCIFWIHAPHTHRILAGLMALIESMLARTFHG